MFDPETFVERGGDNALAPLSAAGSFAYVDPEEPAAHSRIAAVRADSTGSATLVRLMAVEGGWSVLRAASASQSDMEVIRAKETMIRAGVVFVGRAV